MGLDTAELAASEQVGSATEHASSQPNYAASTLLQCRLYHSPMQEPRLRYKQLLKPQQLDSPLDLSPGRISASLGPPPA